MTLPSVFYYAQSSLSMSLISILFVLIVTSTPKTMQNYGTLIFNALISDFIIAVADSLAVADVLSAEIGFVVAFTGCCGYIDGLCYYCFCFIFLTYYQLVNLNFFSFFIRYRAIISKPLSHRSVIVICILSWNTITGMTIGAFSLFKGSHDEVVQAINELYPNNTYIALHGLGAFGASAHTTARYRTLILMAGSLSSTTTSIVGILFLRYLVNRVFREREKSLSTATIKMHKELMKVFSLQTIVPLMLWISSFGMNVHVYLYPCPLFGQTIYGMIGFLPIFNTVVGIAFVRPYRRALLAQFICIPKPLAITVASISD